MVERVYADLLAKDVMLDTQLQLLSMDSAIFLLRSIFIVKCKTDLPYW